jgi:CheY-like chemotaxis protein
MKVLIVDDDPEIRDMLLDLLHGEGFQAQGTSDGGEALQVLAQEDGWVVFLDWMMPRVDGRAVLSALQATPHLRTANQFILMSATARWRLEDIWLADGVFVGALPKPFDLAEVLALLQRLPMR